MVSGSVVAASCILWLLSRASADALSLPYVEKTNPYKLGKLHYDNLTLSAQDGAPLHTTVFYPKENGSYPLLYFIPGGPEGVIPAEWYTDTLTRIVSHGFIVAAVDPFYPLITLTSASITKTNSQHLQWLKDNLQKHLNSSIVRVATDRVGMACHSAGCDPGLLMVQANSSIVNSTVFLEPFSINIRKKSGLKVPAYMYGTQLSQEFGPFPPCSLPGVDYKAFYKTWGCPKWITEVANFGHCDMLDHLWWEACHIGHFCKTVGDWSKVYPAYHEYASGAISAFLIATLQQYQPALQYIEDPTLSPQKMLTVNRTMSC